MCIKLAKSTSRSLVACDRSGKLLLVVRNGITHMIGCAHHDECYDQYAERHHAEEAWQDVGHRTSHERPLGRFCGILYTDTVLPVSVL
jgi:hypothetical protein